MDKTALVTLEKPAHQILKSDNIYSNFLNPRDDYALRFAAWELLVLLDEAGMRINAALWAYDENGNGRWRLLIASPYVEKHGPLSAYQMIQSILSRHPTIKGIALDDISVASPKDARMRSLAGQVSGRTRKKLDAETYFCWVSDSHIHYVLD